MFGLPPRITLVGEAETATTKQSYEIAELVPDIVVQTFLYLRGV